MVAQAAQEELQFKKTRRRDSGLLEQTIARELRVARFNKVMSLGRNRVNLVVPAVKREHAANALHLN
jgi:hypothetical protein